VLTALGQFCNRTSFFNGPRSIVATFKRAAQKYHDTGKPYDIFDFVKDYTSGIIVFDGKESLTKGALLSLTTLHGEEGTETERAIQLLAAFPDGCPELISDRYGLQEPLDNITRKQLGDHVITQALGPTLRIYQIGNEGDRITETLKSFRNRYNPKDASIRRAALSAFWNFVLPKILRKRKGNAVLGWTGYDEWRGLNGMSDFNQVLLSGGPSKEYPFRKVNLRITSNEKYWSVDTEDVHLGVAIFLDATEGAMHSVKLLNSKECRIRLAVGHVIDTRQIPGDIVKLRDIFLPRDVTPLLLLCIADFLDQRLLRSEMVGEQDKRLAQFVVETSIAQRVIKELFSEALRANSEHRNIPIGEACFEHLLTEIFAEMFPDYVTLKGIPTQILEKYLQALESSTEPRFSLAQKRGYHDISESKSRIANKFGYSSHATFRESAKSHWASLMDLIDWQGTGDDSTASIRLKHHPLEERVLIELKSSQHGIETAYGNKVKAISMSSLYNLAADMGYLEDEIDCIVRLLIARGYCAQVEVKGQKVLHETLFQYTASELLRAYQSFTGELKEVCAIERIEAAEIFGGVKWELLEDINELVKQEKANQNIDVEVDEKQHQLEILSNALRQYVARRIVDTAKKIFGQIQLCTQIKNHQFPIILDSKNKTIPITDFSPLLQDLQVQLANRFIRQQGNCESVRLELQIAFSSYEDAKSSKGNRIHLLQSLRSSLSEGQERMNELTRISKQLDEYISNFENWFSLTGDVSQFTLQLLQQKDNNAVAAELLEELNQIVFRIKEDLANNKLDALANWEVFKGKIQVLRGRWEQAAQERRKAFLSRIEAYERLLTGAGISKVTLEPQYDDANPDLSWKRLLQDVKKHLEDVRVKARQYLDTMRNEILKANRIYGLHSTEQACEVESTWSEVDTTLRDLFRYLTDKVVADLVQLESWLNDLKPLIEAGGTISRLDHQVQKAVYEAAKRALEPREEQMLEVISQRSGNLTEVFVDLLSDSPEYRVVEDILPVVISLYKKGRLNLEAKPIIRT
jgi:hypothetical protein